MLWTAATAVEKVQGRAPVSSGCGFEFDADRALRPRPKAGTTGIIRDDEVATVGAPRRHVVNKQRSAVRYIGERYYLRRTGHPRRLIAEAEAGWRRTGDRAAGR